MARAAPLTIANALHRALPGPRRDDGTREKVAALADYFRAAPPQDAAWAAWFMTGHRMKRLVTTRDLRDAAVATAGVPQWLFDASYEAVGDLAETIALLLPPPSRADDAALSQWVENELAPLAGLSSPDAQARLRAAWDRLDRDARFVFGKLITGAFRVGAGKQLVYRALAEVANVPVADVAQHLIGDWAPSPDFWDRVRGALRRTSRHRIGPIRSSFPIRWNPIPRRSATSANGRSNGNGTASARSSSAAAMAAYLWSRGEELVNDAFPEVVAAAASGARGTVIDGEILAWSDADAWPLPFASLQQRINRKAPGAKLLRDIPVVLVAFDLLERDGTDMRSAPLRERRAALASLLAQAGAIRVAPLLDASDWQALAGLRGSVARASRRRPDAQATRFRLRRRAGARSVVEMEDRAVHLRCGAGVRPGGARATRVAFHRLHVRGVEQRRARAVREGVFGLVRRRDPRRSMPGCARHTLERFGPVRRVEPEHGLRTRVRGDPGVEAPQERRRGALSPHPAMAPRQDRRTSPTRWRRSRGWRTARRDARVTRSAADAAEKEPATRPVAGRAPSAALRESGRRYRWLRRSPESA